MLWLRKARWAFYAVVLLCVAVYLIQLTREPASCPSDWLDEWPTPECNAWADQTLPFFIVTILGVPVAVVLALFQAGAAMIRARRRRV
jgi:hypothetical protein